jgi:ribosomal protein S18 acetylase RimI-like enzyme
MLKLPIYRRAYKPLTLACQIAFRPAKESDLPLLEWGGEYVHFRHVFRQNYQQQQRGERLMLLAVLNNYPIGQMFIRFHDGMGFGDKYNSAYFYSLRVMLPFQGRGLGTELIQRGELLSREQGLSWAWILVAKDNPRARRLYERLGYRVVGEDAGDWSYINHEGRRVDVYEPSWALSRALD